MFRGIVWDCISAHLGIIFFLLLFSWIILFCTFFSPSVTLICVMRHFYWWEIILKWVLLRKKKSCIIKLWSYLKYGLGYVYLNHNSNLIFKSESRQEHRRDRTRVIPCKIFFLNVRRKLYIYIFFNLLTLIYFFYFFLF